jgi:hypothetical protein
MAIDWANEPYVRLYKRETDDDLLLSWEARAVWHEMLKKFDRSGLLETRRGVRGLAALIRIPAEVVERVLAELLEDGRVRSVPNLGFAAKNYIAANDTPRSDKARQEASRLRRSVDALTSQKQCYPPDNPSHDVTRGHAVSLDVTSGHSDQIRSDTDQTQISPDHPRARVRASDAPPAPARKRRESRGIPDDWQPREQERIEARSLGLDCDIEAKEFKSYWQGDGRPKKDWDKTFLNRLYQQAKHKRGGKQQNGRVGRVEPHDPEAYRDEGAPF